MRAYLILPLLFVVAGCDPAQTQTPTSSEREKQQTEILASQAAVAVGVPAIKNFTEKRQLKAIYELRDAANLVTYTYIFDMMGKRHKVCPGPSSGFGIPYATQYTNPARVEWKSGAHEYASAVVPQADPNALFSPSSADGTWILCLNPATKELAPTFVEPRVIVYMFEMPSVD